MGEDYRMSFFKEDDVDVNEERMEDEEDREEDPGS